MAADRTPLVLAAGQPQQLQSGDTLVIALARLSGLTSNGVVKTSGGNGTLSVDTQVYQTGYANALMLMGG